MVNFKQSLLHIKDAISFPVQLDKHQLEQGFAAHLALFCPYVGSTPFNDDPSQVCLADVQLREREKFFYEYDFTDRWRHQLRVEAITNSDGSLPAPICLAGKRASPPEDCGGPRAFLAKRQHYSVSYGLEILADIQDKGAEVVRDRHAEIRLLLQWLSLDHFDYKAVNRRLQHYATGDRH